MQYSQMWCVINEQHIRTQPLFTLCHPELWKLKNLNSGCSCSAPGVKLLVQKVEHCVCAKAFVWLHGNCHLTVVVKAYSAVSQRCYALIYQQVHNYEYRRGASVVATFSVEAFFATAFCCLPLVACIATLSRCYCVCFRAAITHGVRIEELCGLHGH